MDDESRAEWDRLAPQLLTIGLLTNADVQAFAMCCFWSVRFAKLSEDPKASISALKEASVCFRQYAREFGLTPSSRAGLAELVIQKPRDAFEELERRRA